MCHLAGILRRVWKLFHQAGHEDSDGIVTHLFDAPMKGFFHPWLSVAVAVAEYKCMKRQQRGAKRQ